MARDRKQTVFFCSECGNEFSKWLGQCPSCGAWNSFSEAPVRSPSKKSASSAPTRGKAPLYIRDIDAEAEERIDTGLSEFSRVLGGGLVPGSVVLIGGSPGVGKSTLLLQAASSMASMGRNILYVSGEESLSQIRLRALRMNLSDPGPRFISETDVDTVIGIIEKERSDVVIIDSVQTMYLSDVASVPGSIAQVRDSAGRFVAVAKAYGIAFFLVGHLTKEGTVAGPRTLEHMVDTVLYFESGDQFGYRVLRSAKNRFGSTNEIGVFNMASSGLKEVLNPSEFLLEGRPGGATGASVTALIEGSRPLLVEVQGLVSKSQFSMPRRQTSGLDFNRLAMLIAVLYSRTDTDLSGMDAYVNIAGGFRVTEPAADLAVIAALHSSFRDYVIPEDTCIIGEVGLSGEVRSVPFIAERVSEAAKLGFRRIILPKAHSESLRPHEGVSIHGVAFIADLLGLLQSFSE